MARKLPAQFKYADRRQMAEGRVERKLTTILAADVVGYSRLMDDDEEATYRALGEYRSIIDKLISESQGRIFGAAGDSVLAEYQSPVAAVRCAVATQQAVEAHNSDVPEDRQLRIRIGINLGDVIIEGDNLLGDGVNVAARLEGLAAPGGICLAADVYRQVRKQLDLDVESLSEHRVKNIAEPIELYQIRPPSSAGVIVAASEQEFTNRPAVAVLPFDNLSGDPEQEYFADGIAEDIITSLSLWRWFPVIARNSSFTYKGRSVDIKQAGRELGARYVLEGSVRKAGARVRITAQLIDAHSGAHVWAERFDRNLDDIFAVQDEITERIVGNVTPEITRAEGDHAIKKRPTDLTAWELCQRGIWHQTRYLREDNLKAHTFFDEAIARDPNWSMPYTWSAFTHIMDALMGFKNDPALSLKSSVELAERGVGLDKHDAWARATLSLAYIWGDVRRSMAESEKAIGLNPSLAIAHFSFGAARGFLGQWEDALQPLATAKRLSPRDPLASFFLGSEALSHLMLKNFDAAIDSAQLTIENEPTNLRGHHRLAVALAHKGDDDGARAAFAEAQKILPDLTVGYIDATHPFARTEDREYLLDGLRKAGWDG